LTALNADEDAVSVAILRVVVQKFESKEFVEFGIGRGEKKNRPQWQG